MFFFVDLKWILFLWLLYLFTGCDSYAIQDQRVASSYALKVGNLFDLSLEKLAATNAELLAIKEQNEILGKATGGIKPLTRCPLTLVKSKAATVGKLLERDGCLSVPSVLSTDSCDELLKYINELSDSAKDEVSLGKESFDDRFGGVNCRGQQGTNNDHLFLFFFFLKYTCLYLLTGMFGLRQDMYLPMSHPVVQRALSEVLKTLSPLLQETVTLEGMIHEVSSFVGTNYSLHRPICFSFLE